MKGAMQTASLPGALGGRVIAVVWDGTLRSRRPHCWRSGRTLVVVLAARRLMRCSIVAWCSAPLSYPALGVVPRDVVIG